MCIIALLKTVVIFLFDAQVMRLQKRKEEVRERLEAVRPKAEVKEEPLEDISRSTVGKKCCMSHWLSLSSPKVAICWTD